MNKERAVLIHSYLADREDKEKPDRLTRLGLLAASELYRHGEIDKICITVEPELSRPQVKRLRRLLNDPPEEDIISKEETVTTEGEVKSFKNAVEEKNWRNPLTIGNETHIPRIKREIRKTFKEVSIETTTPRKVLARYPRYSSILKEMDGWPEQLSLSRHERVLNIPVIGKIIERTIPLRWKIALQSWVFKQLER